jgi:4-amino-4-deoxy-L-arabinose transferase-like glycosyltransferase
MKYLEKQPLSFNVKVILLALLSIVLHLVFNHNLEYHRDELLYFSLGQHPDFGFATVPPLIGWIAWIMQNIFGYSLFAVRLFPALVSGIMVLVVADLAREFGGKRFAMMLAGTGMIISILGLRTFSLYQPVHLDLLFWTLTFYVIIKYINSGSDRYLLIFGIVAGMSLLNKYLIGLLFLLILLVIPFTRYRTVFQKKMFWLGIAAGFVIFLPNLVWQITNGLPVINHLSELAETQLVNVNRSAFLIEQILMPGAASFLTVAGLLYIFLNKRQKEFRFLGIIAVAVITSLMLMRGKSYYTQGIFPFLISAGAVFYESVLKKWYTRALLVIFLTVMTFFLLPFGLAVYKTQGLIKYFDKVESEYGFDFGRTFEDGSKHSLPQDYADMLGWEELTAVTDSAWGMVPDKKAAFIYCENYGQAGAVAVIGKKYGLPEPVCFSESFRYWIPEKFDSDITAFIYINDELGDDVRQLFRKIIKVGSIQNPDAREYGTTVYLCEDPVMSFNEFWTARLKMLNDEN